MLTDPTRGELLYSGKAKQVYATEDPRRILMHYTDGATAFNGLKKAEIADKGVINCRISAFFMEKMAANGVPTAFERIVGDRDQLCQRVEIIPVEVVVRNVIAGGLAKKLGLSEGTRLAAPLVEHFYKSDSLNDPQINEETAVLLGWARPWELQAMREYALRVNEILIEFWGGLNIDLVDFKLEFGRLNLDGAGCATAVVLADEITPDGSRLWERGTGRKLDKDVFRRDLGDLSETYRELYSRIFGAALR
ncbi:MAG: phosphoribosylaminoimidazolesuccinocarboxamide synthase [Myxococcales bacterium]|nr:phosphoribosylaminoimidazolesuccinocarboxamide synthase [Myxococcales bacterium]